MARGDLAQKRDEDVAHLLEAAKLAIVCEDAGFVRPVCVGQLLMTMSTVKPSMFGDSSACRKNNHPRDHPDTYLRGAVGINTKICPVLDVVVTRR